MGGGKLGGEGMEAGEVLGLAGEAEKAVGEVQEVAGGGRGRLGFGGEGGGAIEQDGVEGVGQVVPAVGFLVEIEIG